MGELAGKAVAITGAGQGLGRAYALAVAAAGGRVLVNDANLANAKSVATEIEASGGEAATSGEAVGTASAGEAVVSQCVERFGRIDGLINNAGLHHLKFAWEEDPADAERIIRVNLFGTLHTGVAAMKRMRAQGAGVIVNIGSGAMLGVPEMTAYGSSKAAVMNLTATWAMELAGSGVRVHGISPAARTPMNLASPERYHFRAGPEVVAPLAVFLLSDRAADLHGRMIRMDEGRVSLFSQGTYGPVLGERPDWTSDAFADAFAGAARADEALKVFRRPGEDR